MAELKQGRVTRADTDGFTVRTDGETFRCRSRGNLKKKGGIALGDNVSFAEGVIEKVLPRKNLFSRPRVANADIILAIVSPLPKPDFYTLDKILVNAEAQNVPVAIVVNKSDTDPALYGEIKKEYSAAAEQILSFSAKTGEGKAALVNLLKGKLAVLAGNSAAGKTSVVNAVLGLNLKTGDYSEKILRGRQTTAYSEIYFGEDGEEIMLTDTPGFAAIEANVKKEELPECYPEYLKVAGECRFRGCTHTNEPDCRVKELVNAGELSAARYERYKNIYKELSERRDYARR